MRTRVERGDGYVASNSAPTTSTSHPTSIMTTQCTSVTQAPLACFWIVSFNLIFSTTSPNESEALMERFRALKEVVMHEEIRQSKIKTSKWRCHDQHHLHPQQRQFQRPWVFPSILTLTFNAKSFSDATAAVYRRLPRYSLILNQDFVVESIPVLDQCIYLIGHNNKRNLSYCNQLLALKEKDIPGLATTQMCRARRWPSQHVMCSKVYI